jgi:hypothetical protein
MVIFDYHDDYSTLDMGSNNINLLDGRINPRLLSADKLAEVIEIQENASNQMHVLRIAFTEEVKQRKGEDFWDALMNAASEVGADKTYREAAAKVVDKIDDARRKFHTILDPSMTDPLALLKNHKINVINLVELTERQANIAVSFYLEKRQLGKKRELLSHSRGFQPRSLWQLKKPMYLYRRMKIQIQNISLLRLLVKGGSLGLA